MTESTQDPQAGIADAFGRLSEQTGALVRQEIEAAQREMVAKALRAAPGVAALGAAAVLGLFAGASFYRFVLRLLEKPLGPAGAAFTAFALSSAGAGGLAVAGVARLRQAPAPLPTETAARTASVARDTAQEARREASRTG